MCIRDRDKGTGSGTIQFAIRLKPIEPLELEAARSGLIRVYHQLYGDYESYLSFIVLPSTEAKQILEMSVAQLSQSDDPDTFQLVLKTGSRGENLFAPILIS